MNPKPIETHYSGYRFRSRLEARWAVFFDTIGIKYEYENEGYDLGNVGWYLPDFWLPEVNMFAEVKGKAFTEKEYNKCLMLVKMSGHPCLMLVDTPEAKPYYAIQSWYGGYVQAEYLLSTIYLSGQHRLVDTAYDGGNTEPNTDTIKAAVAAKSARFEHGETPTR